MGMPLPKPELVPYNRVQAMELEQQLMREYSKSYWREATASAIKRWQEAGNRIQVVKSAARTRYIVEE